MVTLPTKTSWLPIFTALFIALAPATAVSPAQALSPDEHEKSLLLDCEEKLCRQILGKKPPKGRLRCDLEKTWGKKDIKKGAKSKSISWGFGDAQCSVKLNISRRHIVKALTAPKYEFSVRRHDVSCKVETSSGTKPLKASLAPKLKFKNGRAKKLWIKLKDIDGPEPLSTFVWTTAKLEDTLGIFHSEMVKQVNKFVHRKCRRRYGPKALARRKKRERIAKRRKERAARQAKLKAREKQRLKALKKNKNTRAAEQLHDAKPRKPAKQEPAKAAVGAEQKGGAGNTGDPLEPTTQGTGQ